MRRVMLALVATVTLVAAAPPAPGRGDPDTGIDPPIGAAARAKHGIEPLTRPTADLGMADDPAGAALTTPAPTPATTANPAAK